MEDIKKGYMDEEDEINASIYWDEGLESIEEVEKIEDLEKIENKFRKRIREKAIIFYKDICDNLLNNLDPIQYEDIDKYIQLIDMMNSAENLRFIFSYRDDNNYCLNINSVNWDNHEDFFNFRTHLTCYR